jgi:hypothetical protein
MMARPGRKALAATGCVLLAGIALAALLHGGERTPGAPPAVMSAEATAPSNDTATLRQSAEEIARRLGVRIVIDHAVRADVPAPRVPDGVLDAARLEAMLRQLLAGHPFVFHYGSDERLRAVWVYARDDQVAVRDAGSAAASVPPPAATTDPRGSPPAASHAPTGESVAPAADVQELKRIIEADASESARMQALDAYVMQADANDQEVGALLERMGGSPHAMLAEHARVLQEARSVPAVLAPEPIE